MLSFLSGFMPLTRSHFLERGVDFAEECHARHLLKRYFKDPESSYIKYDVMAQDGTRPVWYYVDWTLAREESRLDIEFISKCVQEVKQDLETHQQARIECCDEKFFEHYFFRRVLSREIKAIMDKAPPKEGPIKDFNEDLFPMFQQAIHKLEERLEKDKKAENGKFLKHFVHLPDVEDKIYYDGFKSIGCSTITVMTLVILSNTAVPWAWNKYGY